MPRLSVHAIAIYFISLCIGTLLACSTPISVEGSGANLHVGSADTFNAKGGVKLIATLICPTSVTCDVGSLLKPTLQRIAQRVQNDNIQNAYLATSQDASGAYQLVMELPATNNQDAAYGYVETGEVRFIDTGNTEVLSRHRSILVNTRSSSLAAISTKAASRSAPIRRISRRSTSPCKVAPSSASLITPPTTLANT